MIEGIDRAKRWALIREQNQRIAGLSDEDVITEIRDHVDFVYEPDLDDPETLLWLSMLFAHRANRLESRAS